MVLLRDRPGGCEVLLVQRNAELAFHGGAWVFPGGRIDPDDYAGDGDDVVAAARRAAAREAREEAGLAVDADALVAFARWVTPMRLPKRFDTWFFVGQVGDEQVQVDGGEIHAYEWMRPAAALVAHKAGVITLPPPTFVTLTYLDGQPTVSAVLTAVARDGVLRFLPKLFTTADGACSLYEGDAGYEAGEVDVAGPRHRLWIVESGWRYERG